MIATPKELRGVLPNVREGCILPDAVVDNFFGKVELTLHKGNCLHWSGNLDSNGYGRITVNRKKYKSHRLSHEIFISPVLDCVLHSCDSPICVNPAHLRDGSKYDNAQDRKERSDRVYATGEANVNHIRVDLEVVEMIRLYYKDRWKLKQIADKFGICFSTVHRYIIGEARQDITVPYLETLTPDELSLQGYSLRDSEVFELIRLHYTEGESVKVLSSKFDISKTQVRRLLTGETRSHILNVFNTPKST